MVLMVGFQKVHRGKMDELKELNKGWYAVEERLGFPPEKVYSCMFGGHDSDTVLSLREWESMAAMEEAYERFTADPEGQELWAQVPDVIESGQWELYMPVE